MKTNSVAMLLGAIATYAHDKDSYLTKTKLLKLLYLFDLEHFRVHHRTYTAMSWKFFHLGPWAQEYDGLLANAVLSGVLREQPTAKGNTSIYRPVEKVDLGSLKLPIKTGTILRGVLRRWVDVDINDILDYVYFKTEPMECGVRNEPLNFDSVQQSVQSPFVPASSGASRKEIEQARAAFAKSSAERAKGKTSISFADPKYDEDFHEALAIMEGGE